MAKVSDIYKLDQASMKALSKDELLSLAQAGLKQAKQRQYRLEKAGYDLGNYIETFNRRMTKDRLESHRDDIGKLRDDVHYIWNYLHSDETSVRGRINKGKMALGHFFRNEAIRFNRGQGIFKVGNETVSEEDLKEFFKYARKIESSSLWNSRDKTTDYAVLESVWNDYWEKDPNKKTSFKDIIKNINSQVTNIWANKKAPKVSPEDDEEED